jgi:chromate transporter
MSDAQFLDGLALSGVLPAPLVIFATFVGYVCGGMPGALAITAGMFLPAFAFSLLFYERLEAIAEHKALHVFLAGVAAGVVGLIVVTLLDLGRAGVERSPNLLVSLTVFAVALAIVYRWKSKLANPLVLALGAVVGLVALT